MSKLNVYLNFDGTTEAALAFYKSIFGGELTPVVRFKDLPMPGVTLPREDEAKIMHVGLPVGQGDMLMASDTLESLGQKLVAGNNVNLSYHPDSREEADRVFQALAAGGMIGMPIAVQPWGDYYGHLTDKFGIQWMVNYTPPRP